MADGLYDTDILAWSETQADLLARIARGQRVNGVDWDNVVEEIADVGLSQLNSVRSLLRQAMMHLLKLYLWPDDTAGRHWRTEIDVFLDDAAERYAPSMRQRLDLEKIWRQTRTSMTRVDGSVPAVKALPMECPWVLDDLLAGDADTLLAALPATSSPSG